MHRIWQKKADVTEYRETLFLLGGIEQYVVRDLYGVCYFVFISPVWFPKFPIYSTRKKPYLNLILPN